MEEAKRKLIKFYDLMAERWDEKYENDFDRHYIRRQRERIKELSSDLDSKSLALDIATGTGRYLDTLRSDIILAVDISLRMLKIARKKSEKIKDKKFYFILADAERLPFKKEEFEVVHCLGLLNNLKNPERVLKEIERVMKREGYALLTSINSLSFWHLGKVFYEKLGKIEQPILRYYSFFELEMFCQRAQLRVTGKLGFIPLPVLLYLNQKTIKSTSLYKISKKIEELLKKVPYFMRGFVLRVEKERKGEEKLEEFWDSQAKRVSQTLYQKKRPTDFYYQEVVFTFLEKEIKELKGKRILKLDLWNEYTNTNLLAWFKEKGAEIYGVDISREIVKGAKEKLNKKGIKGKFYQANILELPFPDNFFDLVFSLGTIEHTPEPEKALKENYRVIKEGGKIIVGLPNKYNLWLRPFFVWVGRMTNKYPFGYAKSFSVFELRKMIKKSEFKEIKISGIIIRPWLIRNLDLYPTSRENKIIAFLIKKSLPFFKKFELKFPSLSEWVVAVGRKNKN